ncbi:hypothetical protein AVEN_241015-1 [Araneus ventricosus]|uniref:Uncharacterized protein n=1 Tax=Araneus ventricosus TaxID=182803 RepID=A0A4Y2TGN6_ARAVE|nr:hypothetical protein AVEN_241015-1 [Araneus ventricosus]
MVGDRVLQRFESQMKPMPPDLGNKMKVLEYARLKVTSLLETEIWRHLRQFYVFKKIDKLNNRNYASWLDDIKVVLMEKNLWWITDGSEISPDETLFPKEYNEFQVR